MNIGSITDYLDKIAPLGYQENYDNAGLIVGNKDRELSGAILCLDATEAVIAEAIDKGCNLVIAHHPIIFSGLKKITGKTYIERVVMAAIKNDISIYAAHTNLDNIHTGVNARICEKLGLVNCQILSPMKRSLRKLFTFCPHDQAGAVREAMFRAGAGSIGDYDECSFNVEGYGTFRGNESTDPYVGERGQQHREAETRIEVIYPAVLEHTVVKALLEAHPYEEVAYDIVALENTHAQTGAGMIGELEEPVEAEAYLREIKKRMNTGCIRYTEGIGRKVKKVAVCGGSGSFLLQEAIGQQADIFITADFKYHQFFDAEGKLIIADIGHYESEQYTMELFYDILREKFGKFALHFTSINTNPIKYLT